jgi:membrane protein DedA with SNARE-associated domain
MNVISESLAVVTRHGYLVLFAWVTAEQLGAPLPALPILIAAGVLSATGQLSLLSAFALAILACLIGDAAWYALGKWRGTAVLRTLCRISLEPETCVRKSSSFISRHGGRALLIAKFIPGISTVAVPLAANSEIPLLSFSIYDLLGSAIYVGAYLTLGRIVGNRLDRLASVAHSLTAISVSLAILGAIAIVGWRFRQRRQLRNEIRLSRITAAEVLALIESGADPFIVDLRHTLDMLPDPRVIPGAFRLLPDELAARQQEIPRDREIILYCT